MTGTRVLMLPMAGNLE